MLNCRAFTAARPVSLNVEIVSLTHRPPRQAPKSTTQNNLGSVLPRQGNRESWTARLDEAIAVPVWRELLERSAEAQQALLRASDGVIDRLDEGQGEAAHPSSPPLASSPMQAGSFTRNSP